MEMDPRSSAPIGSGRMGTADIGLLAVRAPASVAEGENAGKTCLTDVELEVLPPSDVAADFAAIPPS